MPHSSSPDSSAAAPVITANSVVKVFGDVTAVDRASFSVAPGVVFALLGENGAGKTTLVRMLLGLTEPDAGQLRVLGLDSSLEGDAIRSSVGYVPERPVLYEWMTAAEIGWFTAGFYPDGFEHRYRELLHQYDVPLGRKISQMSKGTRSKVSLSLALAHEPQLLILDEPTSGLDTLVRREFLESMVDLAAAGRTVFLSSHLIGEVERVADVVAIMRSGRLLLVEPLDSLKSRTRELTVTVESPSEPRGSSPWSPDEPPQITGHIVRARRRARQWQMLVHDVDDAEIDRLQDAPGIVAVEGRTPSLEEIFIAYMDAEIPLPGREGLGEGFPTTASQATS